MNRSDEELPWLEPIEDDRGPTLWRAFADDFMAAPISGFVVAIGLIFAGYNFTLGDNVDRGLLWLILAAVSGRRSG